MNDPVISVNVDAKLALNKYNVDEGHAHIALSDYAGCLECGTCRILCSRTIVERWEYPQPTMGVEYRYG